MIEVKNLVKSYGGTQKAVDNLTFTIEKGQIVGFLGPNGAGKSTTMNIITGYISATEGTVSIGGFDILKDPEKAKKNIGYLPEQPPLYMDMTVREYLVFVARLKGAKKADIDKSVNSAMSATKIEKMERRLIKNLSKGYKQRVGIAATLLGDPEVLILDEPTVGLDPAQIIEIRELIKSLAETRTVILSSHILQEISAVCDRIMIINKGKLVLDEMASELNDNIDNSQYISITAKTQSNKLSNMFKSIKDIKNIEFVDCDEAGCVKAQIYTKDNKDIREELFNVICENKVTMLEMAINKKSLEDIFMEATIEQDDTDTRKKKKKITKKKKSLSSVISEDKKEEVADVDSEELEVGDDVEVLEENEKEDE